MEVAYVRSSCVQPQKLCKGFGGVVHFLHWLSTIKINKVSYETFQGIRTQAQNIKVPKVYTTLGARRKKL